MSALTVDDRNRLNECCCSILQVSVQGMEENKEQQLATLNEICRVFQNEFIDTFEWGDSTKKLCRYAFANFVINLLQLNLIQEVPEYDEYNQMRRIDDIEDLIEQMNEVLANSVSTTRLTKSDTRQLRLAMKDK
jgi:hypothetical protein